MSDKNRNGSIVLGGRRSLPNRQSSSVKIIRNYRYGSRDDLSIPEKAYRFVSKFSKLNDIDNTGSPDK